MNRLIRALLVLLLALLSTQQACHAWEWSDVLSIQGTFMSSPSTLTLDQVSDMRVRDIKRRLSRNHGYSADELGRMLDKKELIHALAFEEHKLREIETAEFQRQLFYKATIVTVIAGLLVLFWPLLHHVWEVASVNFVVYTDRKRFQARRCWELQSFQGCVGVLCMSVLDMLQIWLTVSVILSWVMTSKYFFPIPSLSIRPAAFMGGQVASGPLAQYGINVGSIVITWTLRFLQGRLEVWVGRAMSSAHQSQKKSRRENETPEEKEARRAARRARKAARQEEETRQQQEQQEQPPPDSAPASNETQDDIIPGESNDFASEDMVDPSQDEKRHAAAAAAEARWKAEPVIDSYTALDELD